MLSTRRLTRRLVLLCALLLCLFALTGFSLNSPRADGEYIPCCSACDVENPPLACRRGCSPSCVERH
jgi:hypothetical protein